MRPINEELRKLHRPLVVVVDEDPEDSPLKDYNVEVIRTHASLKQAVHFPYHLVRKHDADTSRKSARQIPSRTVLRFPQSSAFLPYNKRPTASVHNPFPPGNETPYKPFPEANLKPVKEIVT